MQGNIQEIHGTMQISNAVKDAMKLVAGYASGTDNWITIKRELLVLLPVNERQLFSRRDELTKQQTINRYEEILINEWFVLTNVRLIIHE